MELKIDSIANLRIGMISSQKEGVQLLMLLDTCFSLPLGRHYFDDFPIWNLKYQLPGQIRLGAFQGEELIASTGVRIAELNQSPSMSVALIGAVATDPRWRGRGLASHLVSFATQWAELKGITSAMLWGSDHALYQRLGFNLFGEQARVPLKAFVSSMAPVQEVHTGWNPSIFDLIRKRPGGLILTEVDRTWFEAHKNVEWFSVGKKDAPLAYAAFGRGIDLPNQVHEWGGEQDHLMGLLAYIYSQHPDAEILGSPRILKDRGFPVAETQLEHLCLYRSSTQKPEDSLSPDFWIWGLDAV